MTNDIKLPTLTETEKLYIASEVFKGKRPLRRFVNEFGLDVLENCKKVVEFVIEEENEKLKLEDLRKQNHVKALEEAAQSYVAVMASAGVDVSLDEAKVALSGLMQDNATSQTTASTVRAPRGAKEILTYTLEVNGKTFEKIGLGTKGSFAKLQEDFDAIGASKEEKWKYIIPSELDRFFEQLEANKLAPHIDEDEAREFYNRVVEKEEMLGDEVVYELACTIEQAKENFNVEITEDFKYTGKLSDLTSEQDKFLIAITEEGTVEAGVEVLEAL